MNYYLEVGMMNKVNGNESSLFIYLLARANNVGWKNPFPVASQNVVSVLGMSYMTLVNVRNRLKEKGLIDFREGKRGVEAPQYCLPERNADGSVYFPWDNAVDNPVSSESTVKGQSNVKCAPSVSIPVAEPSKGESLNPVAVKNDFESLRKEATEQAELIRAEVLKQTADLESTASKQFTDVDEVKKVIDDILDGWAKGGQVHNSNGQFDLGAAMRHLWNTIPFRFDAKRRTKQSQNAQNNQSRYEDKYARRRGSEPRDIPNEEFDSTF